MKCLKPVRCRSIHLSLVMAFWLPVLFFACLSENLDQLRIPAVATASTSFPDSLELDTLLVFSSGNISSDVKEKMDFYRVNEDIVSAISAQSITLNWSINMDTTTLDSLVIFISDGQEEVLFASTLQIPVVPTRTFQLVATNNSLDLFLNSDTLFFKTYLNLRSLQAFPFTAEIATELLISGELD